MKSWIASLTLLISALQLLPAATSFHGESVASANVESALRSGATVGANMDSPSLSHSMPAPDCSRDCPASEEGCSLNCHFGHCSYVLPIGAALISPSHSYVALELSDAPLWGPFIASPLKPPSA